MAVILAFNEHLDFPGMGLLAGVSAVSTRLRSHCRFGFSVNDTTLVDYTLPWGVTRSEGWVGFVLGRGRLNLRTNRDVLNLRLNSAAGPLVGIRYADSDGLKLNAYNYATATSHLMNTPTFVTDQAIKVDIHYRVHPSTGFIRVYLDQVLYYSFTGNTAIGSSSGVDAIVIQSLALNTFLAARTHYSEILVSDETTVHSKVITRPFTAFGDINAWTGAIANVNAGDSPDTTFISDSTPGDTVTMSSAALAPAPLLGEVISRVALHYRANFESGSPVTRIAPVARISGTNYIGTTQLLLSTVAPYRHVLDLSPATGSAWTIAEVNALQLGFQAAA